MTFRSLSLPNKSAIAVVINTVLQSCATKHRRPNRIAEISF